MKNKIIYMLLILGVVANAQTLKFSTAYELSLQNSFAIKASYYKYRSIKEQIKRDRAFMFPHLNLNISIGIDKNRYKYQEPDLVENPFDENITLPKSLTELPDDFDKYTKEYQEKYLKKQKESQEDYYKQQEEYRKKELEKIKVKNDKILRKAREATLDRRITKKIEVSLSQTIYDREKYKTLQSTKIRAGKKLVENKLEEQKLSIKILEYYMNILKSYTKIELYKSYIDYHKSILRFNQKSYKMGLISKSEVMKEKVSYNSIKLNLKKERNLLKLQRKQLNVYLGFSEYKMPKLKIWKLNNKIVRQMSRIVKDKDNLYNNLEYQVALKNIKYLKMQVEVAKSGHYPKVMLNANYTKYYGYGVKLKSNKSVSLNLSMPLFEGGYTQARVNSAKFELLAAMEELNRVKSDNKIYYQKYLSDFNDAKEALKVYKQAYYSSKTYLTTVKKSYNNGLSSIIDLYDAKTQVINTKVDYIQSVYSLLDSYINILILTNRLDNLSLIDKILQ